MPLISFFTYSIIEKIGLAGCNRDTLVTMADTKIFSFFVVIQKQGVPGYEDVTAPCSPPRTQVPSLSFCLPHELPSFGLQLTCCLVYVPRSRMQKWAPSRSGTHRLCSSLAVAFMATPSCSAQVSISVVSQDSRHPIPAARFSQRGPFRFFTGAISFLINIRSDYCFKKFLQHSVFSLFPPHTSNLTGVSLCIFQPLAAEE